MGPLRGINIIEMAGIAPGPFCGMMLADMGANVICVERKQEPENNKRKYNMLNRNRSSIAVDLKKPEGVKTVLKLIEKADALIEGFRPGVMERLGLGPNVCLRLNPKLIYGRITGWGQEGPLSKSAGHDINYISLSGALHAIGRRDQAPVPPLNLIGDFGGGGMLLAFGVVCALYEAQISGQGQVVDATMLDGASVLMSLFYGIWARGDWNVDEREANILDGGAHFYDTYRTADNKWVSIASIEPKFYKCLLELMGINDTDFNDRMNPLKWFELKERLASIFKTKTRDEWCDIMEGTDACFAPVLSMAEAPNHPHNLARKTFVKIGGVTQPAPAPRFSRTKPEIWGQPPLLGENSETLLKDHGFSEKEIESLKTEGVI